jgi:predicted phosphodiesterase
MRILRIVACLLLSVASVRGADTFSIGLIGDLPYHEAPASWERVKAALNRSALEFVVHVGDINASDQSPDDRMLTERLAEFQSSTHPFIYTPGDNEWADTGTEAAGRLDPLERLLQLRRRFFPDRRSLGRRTLALTRQSDDPRFKDIRENARWTHAGIVFLTVHNVGSNNGLGRDAAGDAEYDIRNRANIDWLRQGFAEASRIGAPGLMIFTHAQMFTNRTPEQLVGMRDFLSTLRELTVQFAPKRVVLVHGDSHYFRVDLPMEDPATRRRIFNFMRVEVFGDDDVHWVKCDIDPGSAEVFRIVPQVIPENR